MEFTTLKHIQVLNDLAKIRFSGQLALTATTGQQWLFYLAQGRILYATGGVHPVRRWRRYLMLYCPQRPTYRMMWQHDLTIAHPTALKLSWDFALLVLWLEQQKITREQLTKIIGAVIGEVLFDVSQAVEVTHKIVQQEQFFPQLAVLEVGEAIASAQHLWQTWQTAKLTAYVPDKAPIIRHAQPLKECTSPESYQNLVHWLTGQHTLRDLAVQMQRESAAVMVSLLPFLQRQWIELITLDDLPAPVLPKSSFKPPRPVDTTPQKAALIACVDDSFPVRYTMEKLLLAAGYEFLGIDDPLRALSLLLARKPDLIFLDLMMPKVNGNEVCEQLRKLACFRHTPIVILTGSDGYANRLRCNFAGASEFLTKPLDGDAVLDVIRKHLPPSAPPLTAATYDSTAMMRFP